MAPSEQRIAASSRIAQHARPSRTAKAALVLALFALGAPAEAGITPSGPKDVLMVRVRYSDDQGPDPVGIGFSGSGGALTFDNAHTLLQFAGDFIAAASFQAMTFAAMDVNATTVTLSNPHSYYADFSFSAGGLAIINEATPLAAALGYDPANYDVTYFAVSFNTDDDADNWKAAFNSNERIFMNGYWSGNSLVHELGHSLPSAVHQGFSSALDVVGHTQSSMTRHPFDCMGNAGWMESGAHYIAITKQNAGWVAPSDIVTLTPHPQSTTLTISALEDPIDDPLAYHAAELDPAAGSSVWVRYWLEFRQGYADNNRLMNGLVVSGQLTAPSSGTYGIDLTPETLWQVPTPSEPDVYEDRADCPLVIGQTFADPTREVYVTPLRKLNADPEVIEVLVNFGPFPGNLPPTVPVMSTDSTTVAPKTLVVLTAASSDPGGLGPLSYYWQFEDGSGNPLTQVVKRSERTIEHLWDDPGTYVVTCTVSDRIGGTATSSIAITVDAAVTNTPPDVDYARAQTPLITSTAGTATLEASVTDPDPVTTNWSLVSAPTGASATILNPSSLQTDVTGMDVSGTYLFRFVASDGAASRRVDTIVAVDEAAVHDWGLGKLTSKGSDPVLVPLGTPVVNGGGTFQLQLRGGKPNTVAWLFFGTDSASLRDDGFNSQVYAATNIARKPEVNLDANGEYTWNVPLTNSNFIGKSRTYQVFFRDGPAADGTGTGMSSAVSLVFSDQ